MTDTRLPEHYLTSPALDALSDPAHRVFVNSLMWSVTHGTDGVLTRRSLRWLHPDPLQISSTSIELVAVGLWQEAGDEWLIVDFLKFQSAAADVQTARDKAAATKRRQRAHGRGDHSLCSPANCLVVPLSTVDTPPCPGGTPEDRTGQDSSRGNQLRNEAAGASDFPRCPACRRLLHPGLVAAGQTHHDHCLERESA